MSEGRLEVTPMVKQYFTPEELIDAGNKHLSGRLGNPIDIANTVLFLLSDEAEYINGENINVNGGKME